MVDRIASNFEWDLVGTPCEDVVRGTLCHYPAGVAQRFPADKPLERMGIESYLGVPLRGMDGAHLGHLAVFDTRPMPVEEMKRTAIFRIFAARAAADSGSKRTVNVPKTQVTPGVHAGRGADLTRPARRPKVLLVRRAELRKLHGSIASRGSGRAGRTAPKLEWCGLPRPRPSGKSDGSGRFDRMGSTE